MRKILIHDAHNAIWRSMKRLPVLTAKGKPTQAVFGVLRLLKQSIDQFKPNVVLVCWDSGYSEFRKKIFPDYKGNRDHEKDEFHRAEYKSFLHQEKTLKRILPYLNIVQLDYPGNEADDLIAIACEKLLGMKTIVSTDRDMIQLVSTDVEVYSPLPTKPILYTLETFRKLTGMGYRQFVEFRALTGDTGDNIPGCAVGFGEKSAKDLIMKYRSLDGIFEHKKEICKLGKRYSKLFEKGVNKNIYRNLLLMDLKVAGVMNSDIADIHRQLDYEMKNRGGVRRKEIKDFFIDQSFNSILAEFDKWTATFETLNKGG